MKKRILTAAAALIVAASVHAQSTVDSIASKYKLLPMPGARTLEQTFPALGNYQLTNTTEGTGTVTVSIDSASKGIVWVEGLPQGRLKAYLKKSPATYRIVSQKSTTGKQVQEGVLHYDTTSHQLHIAIGKVYDEGDPTAIFALAPDMSTATDGEMETKVKVGDSKVKTKTPAGKSKTKVQFYTAAKIIHESNMLDATQTQTQTTDSTQQQ